MNVMDRKTLQEVYASATLEAERPDRNFNWVRILWQLADAANALDAYLARAAAESKTTTTLSEDKNGGNTES